MRRAKEILLFFAGMFLILIPFLAFGQSGSTKLTDSLTIGGSLTITGSISKGSGTLVIDHPLDPENKLLYHSFVESPDVKNIYDGITRLDKKGEAKVKLPKYFEALNADYRYLATPIGRPSPNLYIKQGVEKNSFIIAGGEPSTKVSWQITGIRRDPYILANPIIPEVEKGAEALVDKGKYILTEIYD